MQRRWRVVGLLVVLVLAFALVPAVAMASAPAITQGIEGVVRDSVTGVPVPFAVVEIDAWGGGWIDTVNADYDGTYSYELDPGDFYVQTRSRRHDASATPDPITVVTDAVATCDFSVVQDTETPEQPVYRFFNMNAGVHFYTASDEEFISVYKNLPGFQYDGVAYWIPVGESDNPDYTNPNTLPLYRFYNRQTGVHFYTMSEDEKASVQDNLSDMYTFEGVAYYVSDSDYDNSLPIHRFYSEITNAHFYTADNSEIMGQPSQVSDFYHYEGIGYYIGLWIYNPIP